MEQLQHNSTKIDYIVSSGSSFRKLYSNGVGYTIKSYTSNEYLVSAYKTYSQYTLTEEECYSYKKYTYSKSWNRVISSSSSFYYTGAATTQTLSSNKTWVNVATRTASSSTTIVGISQLNTSLRISYNITKYSTFSHGTTASVSDYKYYNFSCTGSSTTLIDSKSVSKPGIGSNDSYVYTSSLATKTTVDSITNSTLNCFSRYTTTSGRQTRTAAIPEWHGQSSFVFTSNSGWNIHSNYTYTFNSQYYSQKYTDVATNTYYSGTRISIHWTVYGSTENRIANSTAYYVKSSINSYTY